MGVPQGDCLRASLFTLYLANTLSARCADSKITRDLCVSTVLDGQGVDINMQYADDVCWITTTGNTSDAVIAEAILRLTPANLRVNEDKTETYSVARKGDTSWHGSKYLGTMLEDWADFKRRKSLANAAFANTKHIFKARRFRRHYAYACSFAWWDLSSSITRKHGP